MLHSIAAWRALDQLIRQPFNWEKTPHGLQGSQPAPAAVDAIETEAPPLRAAPALGRQRQRGDVGIERRERLGEEGGADVAAHQLERGRRRHGIAVRAAAR